MDSIRALCISDVHGEVQALGFLEEFLEAEKPDVILACGDLTHRGPVAFAEDMAAIARGKKVPLFAVHGNMDPENVQAFLQTAGMWVHGKIFEFKGFKFAGWGGSGPTPHSTPTEYSEEEIARGLAELKVDENTTVISHTPPFGTKADEAAPGVHVGSKALREFVLQKTPKALVCGHCHQTQGEEMLGATKIIKVKPLMQGFAAIVEFPSLETKFLKTKREF